MSDYEPNLDERVAKIESMLGQTRTAVVLHPGDIVVLEYEHNITQEMADHLRQYFAKEGVKAVLLTGGLHVARVRSHE